MKRIGISLALVASLIGSLLVGAAGAQEPPPPPPPSACGISAGHQASDHTVISSDGTRIAVTVFRPEIVSTDDDGCGEMHVPVILTLHGWSGSRAKNVDQVDEFLDRGYGVVSIDARGHGDSEGEALVHHPSREVNDFRAVLDWIYDNIDWVQRQGRPGGKDFVVGASGGSYGGGYQLMTAAFDDRLDALVPVVTWNSLPRSLAPNDVTKTAWVSLLYAAGKLSVDLDNRIDEWFVESMATNRPAQAFKKSFSESSPFHWMQEIDVPSLIVQGMPDTLFPLNEGVANYIGIRNNDVPTWLVGVNTGHVLPGLQPTGLAAPPRAGTDDCGNIDELSFDFYDAFLKDDEDARDRLDAFPRVAIPTEQGDCVTAPDWPVNDTSRTVEFPAVIAPQGAGTQLLPLFTATERTVVAGIPRFAAATPIEIDDIFFLSLALGTADGLHIVNDQVQAARTQLASTEGTFITDMVGVGTTMQPGDTLYLRVDGANEQYIANGGRKPGAALLTDVRVEIPIASQG